MKQRQTHEKLAMSKTIAINPCNRYYLLPSSWLAKWKSYVTASGKNNASTEPEALSIILDSLLCEKVVRYPVLVFFVIVIFWEPLLKILFISSHDLCMKIPCIDQDIVTSPILCFFTFFLV